MNLFSLDPGLVFWTWISFGIVFFILGKFVFPNLFQGIKNRETIIAQSIDDAAQIAIRLKAMGDEQDETLRQARIQADALLLKTREEAEVLRKALLEKAELEVQALLAQGRARLAEERQVSIETLRQDLAEFVLTSAGTIVGSNLTGTREREWSQELVKRL